jgi:hypothetical protein
MIISDEQMIKGQREHLGARSIKVLLQLSGHGSQLKTSGTSKPADNGEPIPRPSETGRAAADGVRTAAADRGTPQEERDTRHRRQDRRSKIDCGDSLRKYYCCNGGARFLQKYMQCVICCFDVFERRCCFEWRS